MRDSWIQINLDAIKNNISQMRGLVGPKTKICSVIKANACGHGAPQIARTLLENGTDFIGVAMLDEALAIREVGITAPILVIGYTPPEDYHTAVQNHVTLAVSTFEQALPLSQAAQKLGKIAKVHIKIDAGMGRIGIPPTAESLQEIAKIAALHDLELEGIFMHPAMTDSTNLTLAREQFQIFLAFTELVRAMGIAIPLRHGTNTAGVIDLPEVRELEMVRTGASTYGYYSSETVSRGVLNLRKAMSLKSRIRFLKTVPAGTSISYGGAYVTDSQATIATIPIGFADGYWRALTGKGFVLVGGKRVPIVGKITMDMLMIDVSLVPDAAVGDEVVLIGEQGSDALWADEVAAWAGGYEFELIGGFMPRLKRYYVTD